jgi:hypothetical protein
MTEQTWEVVLHTSQPQFHKVEGVLNMAVDTATAAKLLAFISEKGFHTGSAAYGMENPVDLDYVFLVEDFNVLKQMCAQAGCVTLCSLAQKEATPYANDGIKEISFYVEILGKKFNIIPASKESLATWKAVTALLTAVQQNTPEVLKSKSRRVYLFDATRKLLKFLTQQTHAEKQQQKE